MDRPDPGKKQKLDISNWARKEHFLFFNSFEEPYHGVCVTLDCTSAYRFVKQESLSFFLYCVYQSLAAANDIPSFHYRIEEDEVFLYEQIDGGSVVDRSDGTFGFGYFPFSRQMDVFLETAVREVARIRNTIGLPHTGANNIIRYSVLPWIDFTSVSHARAFSRHDSCPRITFGKMTEHEGRRTLPVSIHVHHALVDGRDLGQYIERFRTMLNSR